MIRALLLCSVLLGTAAAGEQQLVQWRQQNLTDSGGMRWDINASGSVTRGQNSVVNSGNNLLIDGNGLGFNNRQMTADGLTQVFMVQVGAIQLTRRVRLDLKTGVVRWIEILRNPGAQPQTVNLQVQTQYPYGMGPACSDTTAVLNGAMGAKDVTIAVAPAQQQQQQPNVVHGLAYPRSKVRPVVNLDSNNQMLMAAWQLTVPAKGMVAIVHVMMQRPGLVDPAALKTLAKTWQSGSFLADLPPDIRRAVINWGGGIEGPGGAPRSIPEDLIPAPGEPELLALGAESRLRGTATAEKLAVITARGRVELPFARVAAIGGGGQGQASVFLRDGQVLAGKVEGAVRFNLLSGLATTLSPDRVGWLVRCGLDRDAPRLLVNTSDGLVMATEPGGRTLALATCWGRLDLPLSEVRSLTVLERGTMAVQLLDGSRILGQLAGPIEVASEWFGSVRLAPTEVRAIGRLEKPKENDGDEPATTFLRLAGEQILVGEIGLDRLRIMTDAGEVPLLPGQIHRLANRAGEGEEASGVAVTLWGDDTLSGQLMQRRLPVRVHGTTVQVPLDDVVELVVPNPTVPAETRERIASLIRDLGDPSWERREEASKALGLLGALARPALEAAVTAGDPEVRSRAEALIQAIK